MKRALVVSLALLPAAAWADDVFLRGGGRLTGVIVERGATSVTLEVGPGRVTVPMSRVVRIASGTADLEVYRQRAAQLPPDNVIGWLALARWAEDHALLTQARESYAYVLTLDPESAAAHEGLGHVWTGDRWASLEDSYRARGFVLFEGSWVAPEERRAILEERAASAAAERDRIEAVARTREAEARARIAEAEARRAEYDAQQPYDGIPVDMGYPYGGGGYPYGVYGNGVGAYDPYGVSGVGLPLPPPPPVVVVSPPRSTPPSQPRPEQKPRPNGGRAGLAPKKGNP